MCVFALLFLTTFSSTQGDVNCSIAKSVEETSTKVDMSYERCTSCWSEPCSKTRNITELVLSNNKIEILKPNMFTCLEKLEKMNLEDNKISNVRQGTFSGLRSLTHLQLNSNRLKTIDTGAFDDLTKLLHLNLEENEISNVRQGTFSGLRSLTHLKLNSNRLKTIDTGAFDDLTKLLHLNLEENEISKVRQGAFSGLRSLTHLKLNSNRLKTIDTGAFDDLTKLLHLQLDRNKLEELPVLRQPNSITHLEISENPIKEINAKTIAMYTELEKLFLVKTKIEKLPNLVFINNTKLEKLSLNDSTLKQIEPRAFEGTKLRSLILGGTQISFLPGKDLEFLEIFYIRGAESLWEIPIVNFKRLKRATVEYPFHCCLIHSQQPRDGTTATLAPDSKPTQLISQNCHNKADFVSTNSTTTAHTTTNKISNQSRLNTLPFPPDYCRPKNATLVSDKSSQPTKTLTCTPKEDAFNPCDNLLGSDGLRVCSWIVLVLAVLGNSFKLFVLLMSKRKIFITKILMCNLAIANLGMGIFLCMLASADLYSKDHYQNFALRWQYGVWCNVAGFVSIFSTELAVFVLTVITVERYFTIVHPLKRNKHLNVKQIILLMVVGWIFSLTMAALPVFPYKVSSYEKVAICLPFEVESTMSKIYVTFLLTTNGLAFFFVLFSYGRMYCSLGGSGSRDSMHRVESRVAKRMAMLVITNFACWFPIALVSLIAIYGKTLISVPTAKFFLVFVYPINSFTNPYLYAIGTKHFQLDALEIISRLGICNSAIKNISNRLRDELETMPCSSRGVTGSKMSLNSVRSPNQTPMASSCENNLFSSTRGDSWKSNKSYNESMQSNNNSHQSGSSRNNTACLPCNILSIPSIHRKNYSMREQRQEFDSLNSLGQQEDSTENVRPSSQSSDQLEKLSARRASERETFICLEGKMLSWNKGGSRGGAAYDSDENAPLQPEDICSVKTRKEGEQKQEDSPLLRVPTVMVTSC